MAYRGFDACCGEYASDPGVAISSFNRWTGSLPTKSTSGVFGNKYTMMVEDTSGLRSDFLLENAGAMGDDVYSWFTFDFYPSAIGMSTQWLFVAAGHNLADQYAYCGLTIDAPALILRLVTFNYDSLGVAENYVDIALSGTHSFNTRYRVNIRQRYNSGADTMDIKVWVDGTPEIDETGIAKPAGKDWAHAAAAYWTISQFERVSGKGGENLDMHYGNLIWNDEEAGIGPTGQPSSDYVVVMHQFEADTSVASRDDWSVGDTEALKYRYVDDHNREGTPPTDGWIYVGQSLADEQEMALADHQERFGGTASIDTMQVVLERVHDDGGVIGANVVVALHCDIGSSWTPAIFDTLFGIIRRDNLVEGKDLRCYNAYILVLGENLETPPANPDSGAGDQTPGGGVTDFSAKIAASVGIDPSHWMAYFDAPPTEVEVGGVTHIRLGVSFGSANIGTF